MGFDIDPAPLERLKADGVIAGASVREVAERCNIVLLSLPGVTEVKNVCAGPPA
jgi:3-hydroxyisobutyrate dehydrogenase-like beta-hydroxyacid dehydrogenase